MSYYRRTADALLQDLLDAFGAVLIEGPKWLLRSYEKSVIYWK